MKELMWRLYRAEAVITVIAYAATAISLLADVIAREIFASGIWGAPRFAVYTAIVAGFLGMSLAAADGKHVRPQFLDLVIPPRFTPLIEKFGHMVSAAIYLSLAYFASQFVWVSYENGDTAPVLDWKLWPIQLILPYTFLSVAFRYGIVAFFPQSDAVKRYVEGEGV